MGKDGKKLIQNKPSYGTNQLVSVKQDKEIKRIRTGKEEVKLPTFVDDVTLFENSQPNKC